MFFQIPTLFSDFFEIFLLFPDSDPDPTENRQRQATFPSESHHG